MTSPERAPGPIVAAAGLLVITAIAAPFIAARASDYGLAAGAVIGGLILLLVVGVWQGRRGSQYVTLFLAVLNLFSAVVAPEAPGGLLRGAVALVIGGLLIVPVSSREWFARRAREGRKI